MALPTLWRNDIIENIKTTLEAMVAGTNYRHAFETVTSKASPVDAVPVSQCPHVMVVGGSGTEEKQLSRKSKDSVVITLQAYIKPDETRWPDVPSSTLAEELVEDMRKAIDVDPSRGGCAIFLGRDMDVSHDIDGKFSVIVFLETYEYRRTF